MRKFLLAAAFGAATVVSSPALADARDSSPEAVAYLNFAFGGAQQQITGLRYGLRLDQDSRYRDAQTPSILNLGFNRAGFEAARVNGMPFAQRITGLNQNDGNEISYTVVDWGVLLLGVAGAGFLIQEVAEGDDDPEPSS